jgi:hypothetical protein
MADEYISFMDKNALFTQFLLVRLLIDIVAMIILIRFIYYNIYRKRDFFFTFFLINFIVFLLAFLLEKASIALSSGFALLAAFTLLRIRTEAISMNDMTYLFTIMTLGLINSVMSGKYWEIAVLNGLIILFVYLVDGNRLIRNHKTKTVEYEGLENIAPDKQNVLIKDLCDRTGLNIQRISIEHIDFVRGRASIRIYY